MNRRPPAVSEVLQTLVRVIDSTAGRPCPIYDSRFVAWLAQRPEITAGWRANDEKLMP